MRLRASNLGQIVGRLTYGEFIAREVAPPQESPPAAAQLVRVVRRGLVGRIEALLERHREGLSLGTLATLAECSKPQASMALYQLPVERLGHRHHRLYRLKQENA